MEAETPLSDAADTRENETSEGTAAKSKAWYIVGFLVAIALMATGIFLLPNALSGDEAAEVEGAAPLSTETADSTADPLSVPGEITVALTDPSATARVTSVPQADFLNDPGTVAGAFPAQLTLKSNVYPVSYEETAPNGRAAIALPDDANTLFLDLYGWNGTSWQFIPSDIDAANQQVLSAEGPLYQALALAEVAVPETLAVGADVQPTQELPDIVMPLLTEISVGTLTLVGDGNLQGQLTAVSSTDQDQLVYVTNTGVIVDDASLAALLSDADAQSTHIETLVTQAGDYAGINLNYQGVNVAHRDTFTTFVTNLADALHAQGKTLAITLATPALANNTWNTGGQDWAALGQAADIVYVQMPLNPAAYGDKGAAEQLLNWAVRQIDRRKMTLLVNASAVDGIGESYLPLSNEQALAQFGTLQLTAGAEEVEPNTAVEVTLSGTASPLEWDGASLTYKYSYQQAEQTHFVWLGNEAALGHRLRFANQYNLRGVFVRGLGHISSGSGYAQSLESYLGTAESPQPSGAAIVWTVRDADDSVLASASGDALTFAWEGTDVAGDYTVNADFALGDNIARLDTLPLTVSGGDDGRTGAALSQVDGDEKEEGDTKSEAETTETESEAETETTRLVPTGEADAIVNTGANIRVGPGLGYGTIAGGLNTGAEVYLIGRSTDSNWLQIIMPEGQEGWIFATLLTIKEGVDVSALPVPAVDPPGGVAGGGNGGGGTNPAPPVIAPISNSGFELGGQTHTFANPTLMAYAGMNWVKFQHKWGVGDSPNAVAGRIQQAQANGFKVLLSIPGADHSSINYGAYVDFLGGVAALGPDAIEVWNEQNIDREWPNGQIDPAAYVNNMLAPAYSAIKAADSSVMVISGAPAPTGFFGGCGGGGCNDDLYMAGMAAAGAARYMDCIGIHYNEGIISPNQTSGDPRSPSSHYTRYFWGMVNTYWNAFGGARPLCFTELGYLSGDDYGGVPGGFAWAGTTSIGEHAQWLAEAASLSASSGKVRMMIVFNVDFTHYSADPQAGYAMIRADGSCPACETLHQVTGGR